MTNNPREEAFKKTVKWTLAHLVEPPHRRPRTAKRRNYQLHCLTTRMTHIEQAIRDAVEKGGYKGGAELALSVLLKLPKYAQSQIWLDPAFWQALGTARGWGEKREIFFAEEIDGNLEGGVYWFPWFYNWHRFIDHLADGGDSETFFKSLVQ